MDEVHATAASTRGLRNEAPWLPLFLYPQTGMRHRGVNKQNTVYSFTSSLALFLGASGPPLYHGSELPDFLTQCTI